MKSIKELLHKFESVMAAVAFAEAGEHQTALELLGTGKNARKKVLLGAHGDAVNPKFIQYAVNLCQRMGSGLEIVHVVPPSPADKRPANAEQEKDLIRISESLQKRGIIYQFVHEQGCFVEEMVNFVKNRRDILCVVLCGSEECGEWAKDTFDEAKSRMLDTMQCPVVFYGDPARAA